MALKTISSTSAAYQASTQDASRSLHKDNDKFIAEQGLNVSNTVASIGIMGMSVASRLLNEQQDDVNKDDQQKDNSQRLISAINQANGRLKQNRTRCEFSYNEEVNRVSIKVLDKYTQEVIKEIPPEESLAMLEKIWEIAGLLVDERR